MRLVDGQPVADSYFEYGVCYPSGYAAECDDEEGARFEAELSHANLVRRRVYIMEWEEVPEAAPVPDDAKGNVPGLDGGAV